MKIGPHYQQPLCFDNEYLAALNEAARKEVLKALAELLLAAACARSDRQRASQGERNEGC